MAWNNLATSALPKKPAGIKDIALLPELQDVWKKNGFKPNGTWAEVFGTDEWADEVFMAYHIGRFMGEVAKAGKAELNIPMYANAWLGPQPGQDLPGKYPSGGPVARVLLIQTTPNGSNEPV